MEYKIVLAKPKDGEINITSYKITACIFAVVCLAVIGVGMYDNIPVHMSGFIFRVIFIFYLVPFAVLIDAIFIFYTAFMDSDETSLVFVTYMQFINLMVPGKFG